MAPARHTGRHRPPADCPVCGDRLDLTRLGCGACGTELSGVFEPCRYCALDDGERDLLATFLRSRGNMKAVERSLGVSYPTARARVDALLTRLGLPPDGTDPEPPAEDAGGDGRLDVLERLARGELDVDSALDQL